MKSTIIAVYIVFIGSKLDCNGIEVNAKNNRKEVDKCFDDQRKDTYSFVRSLSHGLMSIETNSAEEKRRVKSALRDVETVLTQINRLSRKCDQNKDVNHMCLNVCHSLRKQYFESVFQLTNVLRAMDTSGNNSIN